MLRCSGDFLKTSGSACSSVLIFLSAIAIFGGFSLYAPPNATLLAILVLPALAIAGATFLVVELNSPFHGLLQISSRGAHTLMQMLAQSF